MDCNIIPPRVRDTKVWWQPKKTCKTLTLVICQGSHDSNIHEGQKHILEKCWVRIKSYWIAFFIIIHHRDHSGFINQVERKCRIHLSNLSRVLTHSFLRCSHWIFHVRLCFAERCIKSEKLFTNEGKVCTTSKSIRDLSRNCVARFSTRSLQPDLHLRFEGIPAASSHFFIHFEPKRETSRGLRYFQKTVADSLGTRSDLRS
mmetsp:Transcript_16788/g.36414  ORF Transcript_16788/g.36414 Transcript_16788/m.36414 type:complete len:202 (+) Transcript_16788:2566-3171(+)